MEQKEIKYLKNQCCATWVINKYLNRRLSQKKWKNLPNIAIRNGITTMNTVIDRIKRRGQRYFDCSNAGNSDGLKVYSSGFQYVGENVKQQKEILE